MMTTMGRRAEDGQTLSLHTPTGVKQGATSSLLVFTEFFISLKNTKSQFFTTSRVGRHSLWLSSSSEVVMECWRAFKLGDSSPRNQKHTHSTRKTAMQKASLTTTAVDVYDGPANNSAPTQAEDTNARASITRKPSQKAFLAWRRAPAVAHLLVLGSGGRVGCGEVLTNNNHNCSGHEDARAQTTRKPRKASLAWRRASVVAHVLVLRIGWCGVCVRACVTSKQKVSVMLEMLIRSTWHNTKKLQKDEERNKAKKNGGHKLCNLVFVSSPFSVKCIPPAHYWRKVLLPHILRVVDVVRCRLYFWACVRFPLLILVGGACTHLPFDMGGFTLHFWLVLLLAPTNRRPVSTMPCFGRRAFVRCWALVAGWFFSPW